MALGANYTPPIGTVLRDTSGTDFVVLRWEATSRLDQGANRLVAGYKVVLVSLTGDRAKTIEGVLDEKTLHEFTQLVLQSPLSGNDISKLGVLRDDFTSSQQPGKALPSVYSKVLKQVYSGKVAAAEDSTPNIPPPTSPEPIDSEAVIGQIVKENRTSGKPPSTASPLAPSVTQRATLIRRARLGVATDEELANLLPESVKQSIAHQEALQAGQRTTLAAHISHLRSEIDSMGVPGDDLRRAFGRLDYHATGGDLIHLRQHSGVDGLSQWEQRVATLPISHQDAAEEAIEAIMDEVFVSALGQGSVYPHLDADPLEAADVLRNRNAQLLDRHRKVTEYHQRVSHYAVGANVASRSKSGDSPEWIFGTEHIGNIFDMLGGEDPNALAARLINTPEGSHYLRQHGLAGRGQKFLTQAQLLHLRDSIENRGTRITEDVLNAVGLTGIRRPGTSAFRYIDILGGELHQVHKALADTIAYHSALAQAATQYEYGRGTRQLEAIQMLFPDQHLVKWARDAEEIAGEIGVDIEGNSTNAFDTMVRSGLSGNPLEWADDTVRHGHPLLERYQAAKKELDSATTLAKSIDQKIKEVQGRKFAAPALTGKAKVDETLQAHHAASLSRNAEELADLLKQKEGLPERINQLQATSSQLWDAYLRTDSGKGISTGSILSQQNISAARTIGETQVRIDPKTGIAYNVKSEGAISVPVGKHTVGVVSEATATPLDLTDLLTARGYGRGHTLEESIEFSGLPAGISGKTPHEIRKILLAQSEAKRGQEAVASLRAKAMAGDGGEAIRIWGINPKKGELGWKGDISFDGRTYEGQEDLLIGMFGSRRNEAALADIVRRRTGLAGDDLEDAIQNTRLEMASRTRVYSELDRTLKRGSGETDFEILAEASTKAVQGRLRAEQQARKLIERPLEDLNESPTSPNMTEASNQFNESGIERRIRSKIRRKVYESESLNLELLSDTTLGVKVYRGSPSRLTSEEAKSHYFEAFRELLDEVNTHYEKQKQATDDPIILEQLEASHAKAIRLVHEVGRDMDFESPHVYMPSVRATSAEALYGIGGDLGLETTHVVTVRDAQGNVVETLRLGVSESPMTRRIGTPLEVSRTAPVSRSPGDKTMDAAAREEERKALSGDQKKAMESIGVNASSSEPGRTSDWLLRMEGGPAVVAGGGPVHTLDMRAYSETIPIESRHLRTAPLPESANLPIWRNGNRFLGIQESGVPGAPENLFNQQINLLSQVHTGQKKMLMVDIETAGGAAFDYPFQVGLSILEYVQDKDGNLTPKVRSYRGGGFGAAGSPRGQIGIPQNSPELAKGSASLVSEAQAHINHLMGTGEYVLASAGENVDLPKLGLGHLQDQSVNILHFDQAARGLGYRSNVETMLMRAGLLPVGNTQVHGAGWDALKQAEVAAHDMPVWASLTGGDWTQESAANWIGQNIGLGQASSNKALGLPTRISGGREYRIEGILQTPESRAGAGSSYQLKLQPIEAVETSPGNYELRDVGKVVYSEAREAAFFASDLQQIERLGDVESIAQRQKLIAQHEANRRIHRILAGEGGGNLLDPIGGVRPLYELITDPKADPSQIVEALGKMDPSGIDDDVRKRMEYYKQYVENDPRMRRQWEAMKDWIEGDWTTIHEPFFNKLREMNLTPAQQRALLRERFEGLYGEKGVLAARGAVPIDPLGLSITARPAPDNPLLQNMMSVNTKSPQDIQRGIQNMAREVVSRGYTGEEQINLLESLGVSKAKARELARLEGDWSPEALKRIIGDGRSPHNFLSVLADKALEGDITVGPESSQKLSDLVAQTFTAGGQTPATLQGDGTMMRLDELSNALYAHTRANAQELTEQTGTQWFVGTKSGASAAVEEVDRKVLALPGTPAFDRLVDKHTTAAERLGLLTFHPNQGLGDTTYNLNVVEFTPAQIVENHGDRGIFALSRLVQRDESPDSKVSLTDAQRKSIYDLLGWNGGEGGKIDPEKFLIPKSHTTDTGEIEYTVRSLADLQRRNLKYGDALKELGVGSANNPGVVWDAVRSSYLKIERPGPIQPVALPGDTVGALQTGADVVGDAAQNAAEHTNTGAADAAAQATAQAVAGASVGAPQPVVPAQIAQSIADATNLGGVGNAARAAGGQIPHATTPIGQSLNSVEHGNAMIAGVLAVGGILMLAGMKNYNRDPREDEKTDRAAILGQKPVYNNPNITNLNFKVNGVIRATAPDQIDHNTVLDAVHSAMAGFTNEQTSVKRSNSINDHRDPMDRLPIHGMHRALNMVARKVM